MLPSPCPILLYHFHADFHLQSDRLQCLHRKAEEKGSPVGLSLIHVSIHSLHRSLPVPCVCIDCSLIVCPNTRKCVWFGFP